MEVKILAVEKFGPLDQDDESTENINKNEPGNV